ncbi:MAG TPA: NYN domain-containing protein, partial [Gemmatimonadaceae bacterium]|nr:NYN domain-containing protein [Gemmatimonadaceae bacterium]
MSAAPFVQATIHAPNAALLIDFDNVTMGIRSDLAKELRSLLSSEIIKGKVAVQRAYADWRRYPMYIVPLTESSIDLIFAPAYGSSKKNATDIRLAIDALELVFTRPEIGTFILLSGDSDFSSLVIKLKEYGKYVIGVGIRESSSDLLVQNCDEYYSYNALAGLVKTNDEEPPQKWDPWELVTEAVQRMKRGNDVMRSDRLKQVMQEIDATFDEKNLGISKFSRFCQEAAGKGLLSVTKLENGQLEVDLPDTTAPAGETRVTAETPVVQPAAAATANGHEERPNGRRRGRRGGRGRGERESRETRETRELTTTAETPIETPVSTPAVAAHDVPPTPAPPVSRPAIREQLELASAETKDSDETSSGSSGQLLTRAEAFDLVRRTVADLVRDDESVRASAVRARARQLLGRDSQSLSDRMFVRILKDAHDEGLIDLRRRGNDFEVARAAEAASVAEQVASKERAAAAAAAPAVPATPAPRVGMGPRAVGGRGRQTGAMPANLLAFGVVGDTRTAQPPSPAPAPIVVTKEPEVAAAQAKPTAAAKRGRGARGKSVAKAEEPPKPA